MLCRSDNNIVLNGEQVLGEGVCVGVIAGGSFVFVSVKLGVGVREGAIDEVGKIALVLVGLG